MRGMVKTGIPGLLLVMGGLAAIAMTVVLRPASAQGSQEMSGMAMPKDRVMMMSKYSFQDTVSRIKQAIEAQNMMVVFTADHQAMLKMVGLDTKGMLTIEFFHPRYGKVVYENDHAAGIEMPLRLVVMEGAMGTMVTYRKPSQTFRKYPKLDNLGQELDGVIETIVSTVTK
ncbi:DUF302 domain-containing protein [Nitrospira sp. Kam-Ns4a]